MLGERMGQDRQADGRLNLDAAQLRHLAEKALRPEPDELCGDFRLNPDIRDQIIAGARRQAAILIPIINRSHGLSVLLTKRSEALSSHKGQIAFPGGRIEAEDEGPQATALRETEEETGLEAEFVEIIGRLPDYASNSGYRIHPFVGLVDDNCRLNEASEEIDYLFEVPLAFLMDEANHRRTGKKFDGAMRYYFEMPYKEHYIWGVTAGIIDLLFRRLLKSQFTIGLHP